MSETTSATEGTRNRGVVLALCVIAVFVLGMAMLGTASAPPEGTSATAPAATE